MQPLPQPCSEHKRNKLKVPELPSPQDWTGHLKIHHIQHTGTTIPKFGLVTETAALRVPDAAPSTTEPLTEGWWWWLWVLF